MTTTAVEMIEGQGAFAPIAGVVTTPPTFTWALPDHTAHVSFHLEPSTGPGYSVHADGPRAELARTLIHKGDRLTVLPARFYRNNARQVTLDVDAAAFELALD